jgi:hypothetical protein
LLDRGARFQSPHYPEPPITGAHELRTITIYLRLPPHGIATSIDDPRSIAPSKPGGATPAIVKATLLRLILFADDVGPAAKALLPVSIADHGDRTSAELSSE